MAGKKEVLKRRTRQQEIFNAVAQIARNNVDPVMNRALDEYQAEYEELMNPSKAEEKA